MVERLKERVERLLRTGDEQEKCKVKSSRRPEQPYRGKRRACCVEGWGRGTRLFPSVERLSTIRRKKVQQERSNGEVAETVGALRGGKAR